eukprot:CAMPEP_0203650148 /NCGR_PEP_ID=MMETSP0088-20131115/23852_1 /ASSEMBLY_ACC=CAM_ASM_001087 /TAXON_ID=426623 /ORGANISM="Chaetoceros affinis, Strain CCMP159" /LENGTH=338 /DNA_ID=CAMNT_0050508803 /DNA_START=147 /DNA_END=1163 /DNA_ORIENTATION=-
MEVDVPFFEGQQAFQTKNLEGIGATCGLTPVSINDQIALNKTTLLASYPGSGKRLTWRLLEAFTQSRAGDDWDLSQNGYDVLTLKTSYPHPEGVWLWGDSMDQMILLLRNPRFAIPSYHNMRYELNFSTNWTQSFQRKDHIYTQRPSIESWVMWRDARFYKEMNRWAYYIDFWMESGLKKNTTESGPVIDWHCQDNYMMNCHPQAIIQFEKLYSESESVGTNEALRIAEVLDTVENINVVEEEARPCVYKEVMARPEFYKNGREGSGPDPDLKKFTHLQLDFMRGRLEELRNKFSSGRWLEDNNAKKLVEILNEYINEVQVEYEIAVADYYGTGGTRL